MINYKFSIVVPVFNVVVVDKENLFRVCLDSLINQTHKNIEILLIDDGSKDNASEICDEYARKDCRIMVIHKENEGAGKSRNVGLLNSTGDFVLFVDSDDYIELKTCEVFNTILNEFPNLDIIASNYRVYEKNIVYNLKFTPLLSKLPVSGKEFLKYQMKNKSLHAITGFHIAKRTFLIDNNLFFRTDIIGGEDVEWTLRIDLLADYITVSNFEHYHPRSGIPLSRSNPQKPFKRAVGVIMYCNELEKIFSNLNDNELETLLKDILVSACIDVIIKGQLYRKEYRHAVSKTFLRKNAYLKRNKFFALLYSYHPLLFYFVFKINIFRVYVMRMMGLK